MSWQDRAECVGATQIFYQDPPFDEVERALLLRKQRHFCAVCPVFLECLDWSIRNYDEAPTVTMAGLDENMRRDLSEGTKLFEDWRTTFGDGNFPLDPTRPPCTVHGELRQVDDLSPVCTICLHRVKKWVRK